MARVPSTDECRVLRGDTGRAFRVERANDPRETLDSALWIDAHRVREAEVPGAWSAWNFRQHTDKGKVPGVGGNRDMDDFNGGGSRLNRLTSL